MPDAPVAPDAPLRPVPGRAVVARRALAEIVRSAVLGSYGVTGLAEPTMMWRLRSMLRMGSGAIRVELRPEIRVDAWVTVAYGLPVAEVARQVDSAVRYELRRALQREVGPIAIHVEGLGGQPFISAPPAPPQGAAQASAAAALGAAPEDLEPPEAPAAAAEAVPTVTGGAG